MRPLLLVWFLSVSVFFLSGTAWADKVYGMRSTTLSEVEHKVQLTMHPGYAHMVVERTVFNPGEKHDQATFDLDLPDGAVAIGLRTLGTKNGKPHWYEGELMEAEAAAQKYRELTGIGGYYPKDPALLSWRSMGVLKLQVFPCPPKARKSIEYTLIIPTEYSGGTHRLSLSGLGTAERVPLVTYGKLPHGAGALSHGVTLSKGSKLPITEDGSLDIEYREPLQDVRLELGRTDTGEGRSVQHLSVEVGSLSKLPKNANVVLVLDRSHSMTQPSLDAMLRAAQGYLSHTPDARIQVITFAREAKTEFSGFVSTSAALGQLKTLKLRASNGSAIEQALLRAADLFKSSPKNRPRRVLVLTDGLTASQVTPARIQGLTKMTGALVHLGVVSSVGVPGLEANLEHAWSQAAETTGGLVWNTTLPSDAASPGDNEFVFEEWMRPLRLHDVKIGINMQEPLFHAAELAEGEGYVDLSFGDVGSAPMFLRAKLWGAEVTRGASPDRAASRRWAGLVFGADLHRRLSEDEQFHLAKRANAVSPMTSLLAIEPGVRPSTEGIDWVGGVGEAIGLGGMGTLGHGFGASPPLFNHRAYLRDRISDLWKSCNGNGRVQAEIETTEDEIVAIEGIEGTAQRQRVAENCLEEALWQERLPSDFRDNFSSYLLAAK